MKIDPALPKESINNLHRAEAERSKRAPAIDENNISVEYSKRIKALFSYLARLSINKRKGVSRDLRVAALASSRVC